MADNFVKPGSKYMITTRTLMQIRFVYNLKALADDYINTPTRPNYV